MLITAFKGFDKDLKCRDFQYEIGKEYSEETASLCSKGFHACENPIYVFGYYSPAESRYCEVTLDATDETSGDSKRCGESIHVKTEIGLNGIIEAAIKFTFGKTKWKEENSTTGDQAGAQATGNRAGAQATGYQARAQATGIMAMATTSGYDSSVTIDGTHAIGCGLGYANKVKGTLGSWLVLAERGNWDGKCYPIRTVKTAQVDGDKIKPDTFYTLKNGKFVEA